MLCIFVDINGVDEGPELWKVQWHYLKGEEIGYETHNCEIVALSFLDIFLTESLTWASFVFHGFKQGKGVVLSFTLCKNIPATVSEILFVKFMRFDQQVNKIKNKNWIIDVQNLWIALTQVKLNWIYCYHKSGIGTSKV